jgi:hypothetical protein
MRSITFTFAILASTVMAFTPTVTTKAPLQTTQLEASVRRDFLTGIAGSWMAAALSPAAAQAASSTAFFEPEKLFEPSQMSQGGKVDLNSAFVVRFLVS